MSATVGSRFVLPYQTVIDTTGVPLNGAQLFFYASGTSSPLNTYSDQALTIPNTNPVVANAAGVFPNIFLTNAGYKVVLEDNTGDQIWTADPVWGIGVESQNSYYSFDTTADLLTAFGMGIVLSDGTQASTSGRTTVNDPGGAVFNYDSADSTTADNGGTIRVDAQGRRWKVNPTLPVYPEIFGAIGDGVTNDTVALQAWLDNAQARRLRPAKYLVTAASGLGCLTWSNGGTIEGCGGSSSILASSTTPITVSVLVIQASGGTTPSGPAPAGNWGWLIHNLSIQVQAAGAAKHGVLISVPTITQYLAGFRMEKVAIGGFQNGNTFNNGSGININVADGVTDGFFTSTFEDCQIYSGGIEITNGGDSLTFSHCVISGYSGGTAVTGILVNSVVPGAAGPYIIGCNITTAVSDIQLTGTYAAVIRDCELEDNANVVTNQANILLYGCIGTLIEGGYVSALYSSPACFYMANETNPTTGTVVRGFSMFARVGAAHYSLATGVVNNYLDQGNVYNTPGGLVETPSLSLAGTNNPNFGIFTQALPLQNGWVASIGPATQSRPGIFSTKSMDGDVILEGCVAGGSIANGAVIATLPLGLIPPYVQYLAIPCYNAGAVSIGFIEISTGGGIVVSALPGNTFLLFDGIRFSTAA